MPYKLLGLDSFGKIRELKVIYPSGTIIAKEIDGENCSACGFVPYLRPMSSMTEEEKDEYSKAIESLLWTNELDFFNKYHFDYRGLIPKGLALEAPEGMYN